MNTAKKLDSFDDDPLQKATPAEAIDEGIQKTQKKTRGRVLALKDPEFLEQHSEKLVRTSEMAQGYIQGEVNYDEMRDFLTKEYKIHDEESYDCFTFIVSILKKEFGLPIVMPPRFTHPDYDHYGTYTEWLGTFQKAIKKHVHNTPKGERFTETNNRFTENITRNSDRVPIPHFEATEEETWEESEERKSAAIKKIAEQVYETFMDGGKSSVLILTNNNEVGVHTTFVLGTVNGEKDLMVLEKPSIGEDIEIKKISRVIEEYISDFFLKDLEIHVCNRPIDEVYPETT
jgi:hypothetical protein